MLQNAILSGISQLSPLDGPANSDLVRENVNSLKGGESAYQVAASLEKWNFLQYNLIRNRTYKFNNPSFIFDQWSTNPWRKCGHELYLALSCRVNIISFLLVDPTKYIAKRNIFQESWNPIASPALGPRGAEVNHCQKL